MGYPRKGWDMADRDPMHEELVGRFLSAYPESRYSANELEKNLPGISANDVSRWRRDDWEWLTGKKRRAILRALGEDVAELERVDDGPDGRPRASGER